MKKTDWKIIALLFSVSAVLMYCYFLQVDAPELKQRIEIHHSILTNKADPPFRYRVLVPYFAESLIKIFSFFISYIKAFIVSYIMYDFLAICFSIIFLFFLLNEWFTPEQSLIGTLFVAATMPITMRDHFYQPWSLLETGLFSLSLLLINQKRYWLLCPVILIAAFNRETAFFIPLIFLLTSINWSALLKIEKFIDKKSFVFAGLYFLIYLAIFFGLRYFLGTTADVYNDDMATIWQINLSNLPKILLNNSLFLGIFWLFAILGYPKAPRLIQKAILVVFLYLIPVILFGFWHEVRLFLPLYPIFISLGLSYIYDASGRN